MFELIYMQKSANYSLFVKMEPRVLLGFWLAASFADAAIFHWAGKTMNFDEADKYVPQFGSGCQPINQQHREH
jgi:hypothetical protein